MEVEYIKWDGTLATAAVQRGASGACFVSTAEGQVVANRSPTRAPS